MPARLSGFLPTGGDLRGLVALATPVALGHLGILAQGLVDTAMVGRVDATQLGAVTLGNLYFFGVSVFGMGLLLALDPIVSQAFGAEDRDAMEVAVQRGFVLSFAVAVLAAVPLALAETFFTVLRQPEEVVPVAAAYARIQISALLPYYAFLLVRQVLQAVGRVAPVVWTIVAANVVNVVANWILVFGNLGAPAMGAVGSSWATAISRWCMWVGALVLGWRVIGPFLRRLRSDLLASAALMRLLRLGSPIGFQLILESGAFGSIGLLMGWMGTVAMAGHQIALNLAALTFMIALGISQAATVLVGRAVGKDDAGLARRAAGAALICCLGVMSCTALVFLLLPGPLARAFTTDPGAAAVAALLIPVAGVFQLCDGVQVVCSGVLRGVADTLRPMVYQFLGFWLVGMPVSLWLGFGAGVGPEGLWWGLAVGLAAVAALLLARVWRHLQGELERF